VLHQRVHADDNVWLVLHDPGQHLAEHQPFASIRIQNIAREHY
jgi:hypothetical protein